MAYFVTKAVITATVFPSILLETVYAATIARPAEADLWPCGEAFYLKSKYTCYDGNFLCPVLRDEPTLRCNEDCYLPEMYS
jgi:hypothetical protein